MIIGYTNLCKFLNVMNNLNAYARMRVPIHQGDKI